MAAAVFAAAAFSTMTYAQDTTGAAQRTDADRDRAVTVTGCVMAERDVPGRDDNLFQRWGLMDRDYVLTGARAAQGTQTMQQTGQSGQPGAGAAAATGAADHGAQSQAGDRLHADHMLKIDGKGEDELRQYVNQRVEIRGTLDDHGWFERASRGDRDRDADRTAAAGTAGTGTAGTTGTDAGRTGVGTSGVGGTGTGPTSTTTGMTDRGDRLSSIDVESIRALGPCQ